MLRRNVIHCHWNAPLQLKLTGQKGDVIFCSLVSYYKQYAIGVNMMAHHDNLQHPVSSLPSVQSRVPSQRSEDWMHCLLLHRNAPDPLRQEPVEITRILCINNACA